MTCDVENDIIHACNQKVMRVYMCMVGKNLRIRFAKDMTSSSSSSLITVRFEKCASAGAHALPCTLSTDLLTKPFKLLAI